MKLTTFSEKTLPKMTLGRYNSTARITLTKQGVISLNEKAMALMNLKKGDKISLGQDPDDPSNWYIFKDKEGFEIRHGYKERGGLVSHRLLVNTILDCFSLEYNHTYNYKIGGKPTVFDKVQYWGILVTESVAE